VLDGRRLFEEIAFEDSVGRKFYPLVDGSYLEIENGQSMLYGEAYLIQNGEMKKVCEKNEKVLL